MITIDKKQWRRLLAKARRGDPETQWEVGYHYDNGAVDGSGVTIVRPQPARALQWYTLSAKQGDSEAQNSLGVLLSSGEGIDLDIDAAIYWTKKAMRQGSSSAAHNLGTIYRDMKKPDVAFRWYNRAVEMGNTDSLLQVGLSYLFGFGIKQNFKIACKCFEEIIGRESGRLCLSTREEAQYWMAICHLMGIGIKKSVEKARDLLEAADKDNDHDGANEILALVGRVRQLNRVRDKVKR